MLIGMSFWLWAAITLEASSILITNFYLHVFDIMAHYSFDAAADARHHAITGGAKGANDHKAGWLAQYRREICAAGAMDRILTVDEHYLRY